MLGTRGSGERVVCIACGERVARGDAREYDRHGDRWTRRGKDFEYLCKPCHRGLTHQPRRGLEETLDAAGAGELSRSEFLERYRDLSRDASGEEAE